MMVQNSQKFTEEKFPRQHKQLLKVGRINQARVTNSWLINDG